MKYYLYILVGLINCASCKGSYDGDYCAEAHFYNPNTQTESDYILTVKVDDGKLKKVNFPSGGYMDGSDFGEVNVSASGDAKVINGKGYEYELHLTQKSDNCFVGVPKAIRCKGVTKKGNRCKTKTDELDGFCWQHKR